MDRTRYQEKLTDPRWQRVRLKVFERDAWACQNCGRTDRTLHAHHLWYVRGRDPWDAPLEALLTLCTECHEKEQDSRDRIEHDLLHVIRACGLSADAVNHLCWGFRSFESTRPGYKDKLHTLASVANVLSHGGRG